MKYSLLGPLEVYDAAGARQRLGSPKLRSLLTLLLVDANRVVPLDRLIDQLWAGEPPASSTATLQAYVWQLRKLLEPDRPNRAPAEVLITEPPGYRLVVGEGELDVEDFERHVARGAALVDAGDPAAAVEPLDAALSLWRGTPLADLAGEPAVLSFVTRLEELHLLAQERRIDAELALGHAAEAVTRAETLSAAHPLRERLWAQRILGLYRSGRQADSLRTYQECRRLLGEELGIEPGRELRELEEAVLRQDDAVLAWTAPVAGTAPGPAPSSPAPATPEVIEPAPAVDPSTAAPTAADAGPESLAARPVARGGFVGRDHELSVLRAGLDAVAAGRGRVIALEGTAGIGKTRIVEQLADEASGRALGVVWTRCVADAGRPPLWPWHELLTQIAQRPHAQPVDTQPADPVPASAPVLAAGGEASADPEHDRFMLLSSTVDRLVSHGRSDHLVVVVDDLHSADAASLQLLRLLLDRIDDTGLLVVVTTRRTDAQDLAALDETLSAIGRSRSGERLAVGPLGAGDVDQLVAAVAEDGDAAFVGPVDLAAFSRTLHQRTGGNPFFLTELVKLLRSERRLPDGAHDPLADHDQIPASVRDVIRRRVQRLPDDTQTLLSIAAVAATSTGSVDVELLARASGVDVDRAAALIEPAVLTEVVVEAGDGWSWSFAHDLGRDSILASLTKLQRSKLHARIATTLEELHANGLPPVDELAAQYAAAGRSAPADRAATYARLAAEAARSRYSWDQSSLNLRRLVAALDRDPDVSVAERIDARIELARDLRLNGDLAAVHAVLEEAIGQATALGDVPRLASATSVYGGVSLWNWRDLGVVDHRMVGLLDRLSQAPELGDRSRAETLGTLAVELYYGPERRRGIAAGTEAVEIARELGDPELLSRTLNNLMIASWEPGYDEPRMALVAEALDLVGSGLPIHAEAIARMHRLSLSLRQCDVETYQADLARASDIAATLSIPEIEAQVSYQQATRLLLDGDLDAARAKAEESRERMAATDLWGATWCAIVLPSCAAWWEGTLGTMADELAAACADPTYAGLRALPVIALAESGDRAGARALFDRWYGDIEPGWSSDFGVYSWAMAAAMVDSAEVPDLYEQLTQFAGELVTVGSAIGCWGAADLVLASLSLRKGDDEAVERHLASAERLEARSGFPLLAGATQRWRRNAARA